MLIVKKFGGSSVADKECIFRVAERCAEDYKSGQRCDRCPFGNGRHNRMI